MEARIEDGKLIVTIPLNPRPVPSASGKTLVVASTRGNARVEGLKIQGQTVTIGLNAYIHRSDSGAVAGGASRYAEEKVA